MPGTGLKLPGQHKHNRNQSTRSGNESCRVSSTEKKRRENCHAHKIPLGATPEVCAATWKRGSNHASGGKTGPEPRSCTNRDGRSAGQSAHRPYLGRPASRSGTRLTPGPARCSGRPTAGLAPRGENAHAFRGGRAGRPEKGWRRGPDDKCDYRGRTETQHSRVNHKDTPASADGRVEIGLAAFRQSSALPRQGRKGGSSSHRQRVLNR